MLLNGTRQMPVMLGMDNENREVQRTRLMLRGDGLGMQPIGCTQIINKSGSLNTRLLPQGSGVLSRRSALLQGSGAPPARTLNYIPGIEPASQVFRPSRPAPLAYPTPVGEKPVATTARLNVDQLRRKTVSFLEEYFSVKLVDEALMCVEELKAPTYHAEVVEEAISLGLEKSPPHVELVVELLEYLLTKEVITARDIGTGCLLYGALLDDIAIDLPKAPNNFGEIIGKLILARGLNFKVVHEVLKKMEEQMFWKTVFDAAMMIVSSRPSGQIVLDLRSSDIEARESLI